MRTQAIIPPPLSPGSRVAVVAPAGAVDREHTEAGIRVLESSGLVVERGSHLYGSSGVFSGTDSERFYDLQQALDNPAVEALFCARGGYGLSRIIDRVDFSGLSSRPVWIVGFSDITLLHLEAGRQAGIASVHGDMVAGYGNPGRESGNADSVREIVTGRAVVREWSGQVLREGEAGGAVAGGNLSLITNLLGRGVADYLAGKILFLEDTGEMLYRIDRMVQALRLAGVFRKLAGLVIGDFSDCSDGSVPFGATPGEILMNAAGDGSYPVIAGYPGGHGAVNRALLLGAAARLSVSGQGASLRW